MKSKKALDCASKCYYCELPLSPRHEHDHFPEPDRYGGNILWCVCLSCHDLKDRYSLENWTAQGYLEAIAAVQAQGTHARLLLAKLMTTIIDMKHRIDELEA